MSHLNIRRLLFLSLVPLLFSCQTPPAQRPNVLWIYLEDVSGWFSSYGETLIETPNIDALASQGIRFTRFYTPAGVCSPTRSAIITGMMQTSIGAHNHRSARANFRGKSMGEYDKNVLSEHVVPLPIRFRQAGYWTFNEGGKDDYNFEYERRTDFYDHVPQQAWLGAGRFARGGRMLEPAARNTSPFFGQVQLGGGKLGYESRKGGHRPGHQSRCRLTTRTCRGGKREEIAHHYDCSDLRTDQAGRGGSP